MKEFANKVAVVTGASSGIGKAISLKLAEFGASIYMIGRNPDSLEEVTQQIKLITDHVIPFCSDFNLDEDLIRLCNSLRKELDQVDIFINCAGSFHYGLIENVPVEKLDYLYRINVRAPYLLTQTLLPLIKQNKGQIVFINSSAVTSNVKPNTSQYVMTKQALKVLADTLRSEVNLDGVRVLSVYPGRTATPMQASVHQWEEKTYDLELFMQPDDLAITIINSLRIPLDVEITDIHLRSMRKLY